MNISRSTTINAPTDKIKKELTDFHSWPKWSPWLITEPEASVDVAADGQSYSWEGKRVGSGKMTIDKQSDNRIDYKLQFLKPWKSKADVNFILKEEGDGTQVSWNMKSSLPFFMFFMKKKMEAFVGQDYERGLRMLKEHVEIGEVLSKLEFVGTHDYKGTKYLGIKRNTSMEGMKKHMGEDFGELMSKNQGGNGEWFSIYHKFDFVKDKVSYTACVGVDKHPSDSPSHWIKGEIPPSKFYTVRHVGPYDHIGNAWNAAMSMIRSKEFKPKRGKHPMEFYRNSPENTPSAELVSDISFIV